MNNVNAQPSLSVYKFQNSDSRRAGSCHRKPRTASTVKTVTHVFNNPTVTLCFCDAASKVFKQLHGNLLKDF